VTSEGAFWVENCCKLLVFSSLDLAKTEQKPDHKLNLDEQHCPGETVMAGSPQSSGVNLLQQTQTAYNRFKFRERPPKAISDSK
jgi:hypothetical protein